MNAVDVFFRSFMSTKVKRVDKKSLKIMDEIFDMLDTLESDIREGYHYFWIYSDRGTYTNYRKEKKYDTEFISSKKDFIDFFPTNTIWFEFGAIRDERVRFITINSLDIEILSEPDIETEFARDYSDVLSWIKERVQTIIEGIKNGNYNKKVAEELPYNLRYGTVSRKVFWEKHPEDKQGAVEGLTDEEIKKFLELIACEKKDYIPENRIKEMTFNKYFSMACSCYLANGLKCSESVAKTFLSYGEDFGGGVLRDDIDFDSVQDFEDFYDGKFGSHGGHPWGIVRGSSRTRIMLYPKRTEDGYYFKMSGNPNWNVHDIVKFYLTFKECNYPVVFSCSEETIAYLKEEDYVGFVSDRDLPIYCQWSFPNQHINDFRHLTESFQDMKDLIEWLPVHEVKLKQ